MRKIFTFLLALIASAGTLFAASGTCGDNLTWTLDDKGVLTVSGYGDMRDFWTSERPTWEPYAASVKSIVIEEGITRIGTSAFKECTLATSVSIAESVTDIGGWAFSYCESLTSVTIPSFIDSIYAYAFYECYGLESIICEALRVPECGNNCFFGVDTSIPVYVRFSVLSECKKRDPWNKFTNLQGTYVQEGTCGAEGDNLTWKRSANILTIKGTGAMADWKTSRDTPWSGYAGLKKVIIEDGVTSVGSSAFWGSDIESVTLGNSVAVIGDDPFGRCDKFESFTVSEENPYFSSENGVLFNKDKTVLLQCPSGRKGAYTMPNSVVEIADAAFYRCDSLRSVVLGENLSIIGDSAFFECDSLASVTMSNNVTEIGNYAFYNCCKLSSIYLSNRLKRIGTSAFAVCSGLTSITIPASVETIKGNPFFGCTGLTSIQVESGNTKYDSRENCNALINTETNTLIVGCDNTVIPSGVKIIAIKAFYDCKGLTSVTIPSSVDSISSMAFQYCRNLTSMSVESGNTRYDSRNNCNAIIETAKNYLLFGCQKTIIPEDVTRIHEYAFQGCRNLTAIVIPNSVTAIGKEAFSGCSGLTVLTLPKNLAAIGLNAFSSCTGLASITCRATTPPKCYMNGGFNFVDKSIPVYVPKGTESDYRKAVEWKQFTNIQAIVDPSGKCGADLKWTLDEDGILTITGTGAMTDWSSLEAIPWHNLRMYIKTVIIKNGATSISASAFDDCAYMTYISIPSSVTSVGAEAFSGCSKLEELSLSAVPTIPAGLCKDCSSLEKLYIGVATTTASDALSGCTSLKNITVDNRENTAFASQLGVLYNKNYSRLILCPPSKESYTFLSTVTSIQPTAFAGCAAPFTVTCENETPPTVNGKKLFADVTGTVDVYVPATALSAYQSAWGTTNCQYYALQEGECTVNGIKYRYKADGTAIVMANTPKYSGDIVIPETISYNEHTYTVTTLDLDAFAHCTEMTSITLPNSLKTIGISFNECTGLKSITIPESVSKIDGYAFMNCSNLDTIYFKPYLSVPYTYYDYLGLISKDVLIYVPSILLDEYRAKWSEMTNIQPEPIVVNGLYYSINTETRKATVIQHPRGDGGYDPLVNITIPEAISVYDMTLSVDSIGPDAFRYCEDILSVSLPNTLVSIGEYAFYWCTSLPEITIPKSVTSIGDRAFLECKQLTTITIPEKVATIGSYAFANCSGLTSITSVASTPPTCGSYCFRNVDKTIPLYVPEGKVAAYSDAKEWKDFTPVVYAEVLTVSDLAVKNVTNTSANLSWTGAGQTYDLRYAMHNGYRMGFEKDEDYSAWTTIDADGDGVSWFRIANDYAHTDSIGIISFSWNRVALNPDDYLVSPLVELGGTFSFWARGNYLYPDLFSVCVSTTSNTDPSAFTNITGEEYYTNGDWTQYTFDLDAYKGQNGYIAIRHYNSEDQNYIVVDDIEILPASIWTEVNGLTANSYALSGLVADTIYEIQVRSHYRTEVGDWTKLSFKTFANAEDAAATNAVIELIDAIGTPITLASEEAIVTARAAYDALNDALKGCVTNYDTLTEAEDALADLKDADAWKGWTYYDDRRYSGSYGNFNTVAQWGIVVPASSMTENTLTKIALFEGVNSTEPVTVTVYNGGDLPDEANAVYTETFYTEHAKAYHIVTLKTPVTIDPTKNVWIIMTSESKYPMSFTENAYTANTCWLYVDKWYEISALEYGAWKIRALFEENEEEPDVPAGTVPYKLVDLSKESVTAGEYIIVFDDNKAHAAVSGKDLIASSDELTFEDDYAFVPEEAVCAVTIAPLGTDSFSILLADGTSYMDLQAKNSVTTAATPSGFAITAGDDKTAQIAKYLPSESKTYVLKRNGNYFRMYNGTTYTLPKLYRKKIVKYTVTFVDWDGTELKKEAVEYGKAATAPADPTRAGYRFTGWDKAFDHIIADLTVTAQYEAIDYTPSNLNALLVPKESDLQITLSWDKVEGAASYELRLVAGEKELFSQNTMGLNVISSLLSVIEKTYSIDPGTYTMSWAVRSTDAMGKAISDWAAGPQFEITIKGSGTGVENVQSDNVPCTKVLRDGMIFILRDEKIYTITGQEVK